MQKNCKTCVWEIENNVVVDKSMSAPAWGKKIGCAKSSVLRHWAHSDTLETLKNEVRKEQGYFFDIGENNFEAQSSPTSDPVTQNDVDDFIRSKGLDPNGWDYDWRFSEWEQRTKSGELVTLHSIRVSGKRKQIEIDVQISREIMSTFLYKKPKTKSALGSFVIVPTDLQLGKVDWNGGTKETIDQVLSSFHKAKEICLENEPKEICVIDAGDIIENIYNIPSQLATNDVSLPDQIVVAFDLMMTGLGILSEAGHVRYVSVPSNHGAHRIALQKRAGNVQDDWGIALAKMLDRSTDFDVIYPDPYQESVVFETSGSILGVAHSHQAGSPEKIGDWWARQTHGNMPTSQARILVAGHWHSLRVQQSGDEKWLFVGPASDRGSSWYANTKGDRATSGMLSFFTKDNSWSDLQIL